MSNLRVHTLESLGSGDVFEVGKMGYTFDYAAGITISSLSQTISDGGLLYRVSRGTPLPYTTTGLGLPEDGALVLLDAGADADVLRDELASDGGAQLVGNAKLECSTLESLKLQTWPELGMVISTSGYAVVGDSGSNDYEIVAADTGGADGGNFIDLPLVGLQAKGLFKSGIHRLQQYGVDDNGEGKQWIPLRANSVEPEEGEDWSELVSQKTVTDTLATFDFDIATGPYGLRWNQETNIYTELGATVRTQIQSKMRRCVLNSDGTVNYYLDPFDSTKKEDGSPAILDGTDGNVMVEIPKFYYKHALDGNVHEWWIGESAEDGMEVHPYFLKDGVTEVDFAYYRAYEGFMQAGVLKSISGVTPTRSLTRAAFRTAARLNGAGWNIAHLHGINAVRMLYLLEYNSFNSQSKLGTGKDTGTVFGMLTGQSNVIGNDSSGPLNNNTWMSYRGIENFYGDIWEFIDGFNVEARVPFVSNVEADFADGVYIASYVEGTVMPVASDSWIQKITGDFLPTQVGGSSATYITDACWTAATPSLSLHGGRAGIGFSAGAFALLAHHAFAYVNADIGAGLSFR